MKARGRVRYICLRKAAALLEAGAAMFLPYNVFDLTRIDFSANGGGVPQGCT